MKAIKKHKIVVVGLLAAVILGIVALIAIASGENPVEQRALSNQGVTVACRGAKSCSDVCTKPCFKAKNAEEKVKSCPFGSSKSCCDKN